MTEDLKKAYFTNFQDLSFETEYLKPGVLKSEDLWLWPHVLGALCACMNVYVKRYAAEERKLDWITNFYNYNLGWAQVDEKEYSLIKSQVALC